MNDKTSQSTGEPRHMFQTAGQSTPMTWTMIGLCAITVVLEIGGGSLFGSLALAVDGLHLSIRVAAMLIAVVAYVSVRKRAKNPGFVPPERGRGYAGFIGTTIVAMIGLLILYLAVLRLFHPIGILFNVAIPIACLGLFVNIVTASMPRDDATAQLREKIDEQLLTVGCHRVNTGHGILLLEIFEHSGGGHFRVGFENHQGLTSVPGAQSLAVDTIRPNGERRGYTFVARGIYLESVEEIPLPHAFVARICLITAATFHSHEIKFGGRGPDRSSGTGLDHSAHSIFLRIFAKSSMSALAIAGLATDGLLGWRLMDPLVGIVGVLLLPLRKKSWRRPA